MSKIKVRTDRDVLEMLWKLEKQLDSMNQHCIQALKIVRKIIGDPRVNKPTQRGLYEDEG